MPSIRHYRYLAWCIGILGAGLNGCSEGPPTEEVKVSELRGSPTTIGIFRPQGSVAWWFLRNDNSPGNAFLNFEYGSPGDTPVAGDWDGDGKSTIGIYRAEGTTRYWMLRNNNSAGPPDFNIQYGGTDDLPVVGDWDGNGTVTIGIYRTYTHQFLLKNTNSPGNPDITISLGVGDDIPVAGDWDGDGKTTVGVYHKANGQWTLRNAVGSDIVVYGGSSDIPIAGDWDGDGKTTIGVVRASGDNVLHWLLRNANAGGNPDIDSDINFGYGVAGDKPVAGAWQLPNVQPMANAVSWTDAPVDGASGTFLADVTGPDTDGKSRADVITIDGDGIRVRKSQGLAPLASAQVWCPPGSIPVGTFFADVTGDGKADEIEIYSTGVWVRPSTGSAFGALEAWLWINQSIAGEKATFVVDVTGDGLADVVAVNAGDIKVWRALSDRHINGAPETWSQDAFGTVGTFIADVTGDGRADAVIVDAGTVRVRRAPLSGNAPFAAAELWSPTAFSGTRQTLLADVTGDGVADLVAVNTDGITARRSGRWFFNARVEVLSTTATSASALRVMADLTGDGRAEYIELGASAPVQVRVRQDRRIPIRFVQFADTCSNAVSDEKVRKTLDDTNLRYKDAGIWFYAQPASSNPPCPGFDKSNIVLSQSLADLHTNTNPSISPADLPKIRDAIDPDCNVGTIDVDPFDTVAARCGRPGELLVFVTALGAASHSAYPNSGKLILLDKDDGFIRDDGSTSGRLPHEIGHYLGVPHTFDFSRAAIADPLTGQGAGMAIMWDLVWSSSQNLFFDSKSAASQSESSLSNIEGPRIYVPAVDDFIPNGWFCPGGEICPAQTPPPNTAGIPLTGDKTKMVYTYCTDASTGTLCNGVPAGTVDRRLKGIAPHTYDGAPIDKVAGVNVMSYGYNGTGGLGATGWFSLSQIDLMLDHLANNLVTARLDATGRVIFGDRPLLGTVGPKATIRYAPTGGVAKLAVGTLANNGNNTWVVGTPAFNPDGNRVYQWNQVARTWDAKDEGAQQLALPSDGSNVPWAITGTNSRVKQWNGSEFAYLTNESSPPACSTGLAVGVHSSGTFTWSIKCGSPDAFGNRAISRYGANGWQSVAGPAGIIGGQEIAVDWDGTPWVRTNRGGTMTLYHATLDGSGLPSWTEVPAPSGSSVTHLSSGIGGGIGRLRVNIRDSANRLYFYNGAGNSWLQSDPLPFTVSQIAGTLPYIYVVNAADGSIWYSR